MSSSFWNDPVTSYRLDKIPAEFELIDEANAALAGMKDSLAALDKLRAIPSLFKKIEEDILAIEEKIGDAETEVSWHSEWLLAMDSPSFDHYAEEYKKRRASS